METIGHVVFKMKLDNVKLLTNNGRRTTTDEDHTITRQLSDSGDLKTKIYFNLLSCILLCPPRSEFYCVSVLLLAFPWIVNERRTTLHFPQNHHPYLLKYKNHRKPL